MGWRAGMVGFLILSLLMLPAAWYAGRVDQVPLPPKGADDIADTSGRDRGQGRIRQCLVCGDDAGLFRLRHAARLSHHASAVLSGDLRHGSMLRRRRRWA